MDTLDQSALDELSKREKSSGLEYETIAGEEAPIKSLGKASFLQDNIQEPNSIAGMDSPWKKIHLTNLPSEGFGYPPETEITIRPADVKEIKHFSIIDENDPIDIDDKMNHIISKCCVMKWHGGILNFMDIYQEDRFYVFMAIRDLTFIKGENRIFIPVKKECKNDDCPIPSEIELNSLVLSNFKLSDGLKKYYDIENGCFNIIPKNGDPAVQLFIPTIGVSQKIRKILKDKALAGKKYDEAFAKISPYVIANWRDLDEKGYDEYEKISDQWTYTQFVLADGISKEITFSTKNNINVQCSKCGAEVTAPIRFPGGVRSLYVVSDIFGQLL